MICLILGSVGALALGKPSLKLLRSDRQVVSLEAKPSSPARAPRVATEYPKAGIIVAGPIASGFSVAYPDRA